MGKGGPRNWVRKGPEWEKKGPQMCKEQMGMEQMGKEETLKWARNGPANLPS